jgi:hypothetical protein
MEPCSKRAYDWCGAGEFLIGMAQPTPSALPPSASVFGANRIAPRPHVLLWTVGLAVVPRWARKSRYKRGEWCPLSEELASALCFFPCSPKPAGLSSQDCSNWIRICGNPSC